MRPGLRVRERLQLREVSGTMLARLWLLLVLIAATVAAMPGEPRGEAESRPPLRQATLPPVGVTWRTVVIDDERDGGRIYVGWTDAKGVRRCCDMSLSEFRVQAASRHREDD